jgi:hypothetical protein
VGIEHKIAVAASTSQSMEAAIVGVYFGRNCRFVATTICVGSGVRFGG